MRRALALSLLYAACGLLSFDIEQDIPPQTVAGSPLGGLLPAFLAPFPFNIDLKSEQAKHDTGPASSITLSSISFTAQSAGNFDFLDEVHIFISAPSNSSLPRIEVASLTTVPKGQTSIHLGIKGGVDLLPYVNAGAQLEATASGTSPAQDFTFDGKVVLTVHV